MTKKHSARAWLISLLSVLAPPNNARASIAFTDGFWRNSFDNCTSDYNTQSAGAPAYAPVPCDSTWQIAGYHSASCGLWDEITAAANFPGGAGGRALVHRIGTQINDCGGGLRIEFPAQNEIWIRVYLQYEAGFAWDYLQYNKLLYVNNAPPTYSTCSVVPELNGSDGIGAGTMNVSQNYFGSGFGWASVFADNQWHAVEWHLKRNTSGANGVIQTWVDGQLAQSAFDVDFGPLSGPCFREITFGHNVRDPDNPGCKSIFYDDVLIATTSYNGFTQDVHGNPMIGTIGSSPTSECNDGVDNDGDGETDFPDDAGCTSASDHDESNCDDGACEGGESCTDCPGDCLVAGEVCCSGATHAGDCCSEADCSGSETCESHVCTAAATCINQGNRCCDACQAGTARPTHDSDCGDQVCCGLCSTNPATLLFMEDFEDINFGGKGWYDGTDFITSTSVAHAGSRSAEFHFAQHAKTPDSGGAIRRKFPGSEAVYVRFWLKHSSSWTGSNHPYHPHEIYLLTNENGDVDGMAYTHLTFYIEENEGVPLLGIQDGQNIDASNIGVDLTGVTEQRAVAACNGNSDGTGEQDCYPCGDDQYCNGKMWRAGQVCFQDSPGPYDKTDWHQVEAYVRLNSIVGGVGQADGAIAYWFDGELQIGYDNVLLRTGAHPDMVYDQFVIAPYIGDGSPADQTVWIDDLLVGNARPTSCEVDADGDNYGSGPSCFGDDCDDDSGAVFPGASEYCNGVDDDCDTYIDEDWPALGTTCTAGLGACRATGSVVCLADGTGVECDAGHGTSSTEICGNDIDEDCDGSLDNGCDCTTGDTRVCYAGPSGTDGVGICHSGTQICTDSRWSSCQGQGVPDEIEDCSNGRDDDCNGLIDAEDMACVAHQTPVTSVGCSCRGTESAQFIGFLFAFCILGMTFRKWR